MDSTSQPHFDGQPITVGRIETIESTDGGVDAIRSLTGYDIVLGGHEKDTLRVSLINEVTDVASADSNIVFGDTGYVDYVIAIRTQGTSTRSRAPGRSRRLA